MNIVDVAGLLVPRAYFAIVLVTRIRDVREAPARRRWEAIALAILLSIETVATILTLATGSRWSTLQPWWTGARLGVVVAAACAAVSAVAFTRWRAARRGLRWPIRRLLRREGRGGPIDLLKLSVALILLLAGIGQPRGDET